MTGCKTNDHAPSTFIPSLCTWMKPTTTDNNNRHYKVMVQNTLNAQRRSSVVPCSEPGDGEEHRVRSHGRGMSQFNNEQYRSAIFFTSKEQESEAKKSMLTLQAKSKSKQPIATQLVPATDFYYAEEYHQHFLTKQTNKQTNQQTSTVVTIPWLGHIDPRKYS